MSFGLPEVADADGRSSFAFVLPIEPGRARDLESVTLIGPGGVARLDAESDMPTSILIDPNTGQVRGILRDVPQTYDATASAAPLPDGIGELVWIFSRGIQMPSRLGPAAAVSEPSALRPPH